MQRITAKLTVYFEDPFWVGVYESESCGQLEVCKTVFGAQPKDCEIYEYFIAHWRELLFTAPIPAEKRRTCHQNPKRIARSVRAALSQRGTGTKAQQALGQAQEQYRLLRSANRRERLQEEKRKKFELRQQKKKEKHRGH